MCTPACPSLGGPGTRQEVRHLHPLHFRVLFSLPTESWAGLLERSCGICKTDRLEEADGFLPVSKPGAHSPMGRLTRRQRGARHSNRLLSSPPRAAEHPKTHCSITGRISRNCKKPLRQEDVPLLPLFLPSLPRKHGSWLRGQWWEAATAAGPPCPKGHVSVNLCC